MKYLLLVIAFTAISVHAEDDGGELREGPCNKIREACKTYVKSGNEKKSLYRDCIQPVLNDEKIEGLKIEESVVKACRAKKAELKSKK